MSAKFPLPKAELEAKIAKGEIDTVVVAMTDMQAASWQAAGCKFLFIRCFKTWH